MTSDFRKKLREIARRKAKGLPPLPPPEKAQIQPLCDIWSCTREEDILTAEPSWPSVVPPCEIDHTPPNLPLAAFDIETMGLRGMPIFLVGFGFVGTDGVTLRQYVAEHISSEKALLEAAVRDIESVSALVTFNGAAFDLPETEERAARYNIDWDGFPHHFDLLHITRRCYKQKLRDFKLRTVEENLLEFTRADDLPSSEVPRMYNLFSQTGDGRPLLPVLEHNLIDIAATVALLLKLAQEFPDEFLIPEPDADTGGPVYPLFNNR